MRPQTWPILWIACCATQALAGGAGRAASYSADAIKFRSDPVAFRSDRLSFPSAPVQTETASTIEVTLPADILFDFDKAEIRTSAQDALHEMAQLLREKARGPVRILGYTDALGADAYNQRLSERRAAAVKAWFRAHEGLASISFTAVGFGAHNPVAANRKPDGSDDPEGRQLNRRVTIILRK